MIISVTMNDAEVRQKLDQLLANSRNTGPAMAGIAARMLGAVEDNFKHEGRPNRWAPLKPSTLAARRGGGGKILQNTGKLAASMTMFYSNNNAGVGTNRPGAAAQNNGSRPHIIEARHAKALKIGNRFFKRVKHPGTVAREFFVLTDNDNKDVVQIIAQHLVRRI